MAGFIPFIPLAHQLVQSLMNGFIPKQNSQSSEETANLRRELEQYHQKHGDLLKRFDELTEQLKKKKIESFEDLAEQDKQAKAVLIQLAQKTPADEMKGKNIGLFGLTSTGKSTMLNSLLGEKVAKTGAGETTTEITPYNSSNFTLWDVPGRNDEIAYLSMKYIAFFKGLSRRVILIQATVKENSSMMKLLDEVGLHYDIVFNKFDSVDDDEQPKIKQSINDEIKKLGLKCVDRVFFVSAKTPKMFSDWLVMVDYLTK